MKEMEMTRIIVLVALFVVQVSAIQASAQQSPKLLDKYQCKGTGENGEYTTPLTIETKGENFLLRWTDSVGMGFRHNDDLVVAFVVGGAIGVSLYHIDHGKLTGWWSGGDGKVYQETCTAGIQA